MEYLHLFKTKTEHDSFYGGNKYKEPWLAYTRDNTLVTGNKSYDYYRNEYLTLSALEDGQIEISISSDLGSSNATYLSYSKDKSVWEKTDINGKNQTITIPVFSGDNVYLKGEAKQWSYRGGYMNISSTTNFIASGNIMSLLYGDNFKDNVKFTEGSNSNFAQLFQDNEHLINAENLILPATTLAESCYQFMFSGCSSLTTAPELPATTLASSCYDNMFSRCTSLTTAPELPAATLKLNCYYGMFQGCSSLKAAPALPATTLAQYCYSSMFSGCTSLTKTPKLPATELTIGCYDSMFNGCSSLTTAHELPATELAQRCYCYMFQNCTSLEAAPELPATTLAIYCYNGMFKDCSKLNNITMLATDISANGCLKNWVSGVASTGTFTKATSMTSLPSGESGIPTGWTVVNK